MKKTLITLIIFIVACGPSEDEIQNRVNEAVVEAIESQSTTTAVPLTTTSTTTTTTVPPTTTTVPSTTTTTTTVPQTTNYSLKFGDQINQFPEIPYCKMTYSEVEKQLNEYFLPNKINLTIREYLVESQNTECHGFVSGSNYSYLNQVNNGDFIEITVESNVSLRRFPTSFANTLNAKGNNEFHRVICDISGRLLSDKFWHGAPDSLNPKGVRDIMIYSQPNYLNINLYDEDSNCTTESWLRDNCYLEVRLGSFGEYFIYRHYDFPAEKHYENHSGAQVKNYCEELDATQDN